MRVAGIRLAAALTFSCGLLTAAQAETTTLNFDMHWATGELNGTSTSGFISYDSALAVPNARYLGPNLLTDFGFTLRGTFYDLSMVQTLVLSFDNDAKIFWFVVGTDCQTDVCYHMPNDTSSFYITNSGGIFQAVASDPNLSFSWGNDFKVSPVPEPSPAALWLVGLGLGGLLSIRRLGQIRAQGADPIPA